MPQSYHAIDISLNRVMVMFLLLLRDTRFAFPTPAVREDKNGSALLLWGGDAEGRGAKTIGFLSLPLKAPKNGPTKRGEG
jgi:hypothetical protein